MPPLPATRRIAPHHPRGRLASVRSQFALICRSPLWSGVEIVWEIDVMIRLFRFLKPYRGLIAVVLVLAFLQSLANLYLPTLMADIVDTGIVTGDTNYILRVGGLMLLIT